MWYYNPVVGWYQTAAGVLGTGGRNVMCSTLVYYILFTEVLVIYMII